ncbi:MAG: tannase/feruloyl esterase family alpha/beta hydrolase [Lautropia sp.]|nr:tannase/feruloyl esterase family alpha/beta hydrolase [Lautropia sp.]
MSSLFAIRSQTSLSLLICVAWLLPAGVEAAQNLAPLPPVVECSIDSFARVGLREAPTRITSAEIANVDEHRMCVIEGVISPQIRFMVRLPVDGWTQRYLQTGCGGLCGRLGIQSPQRDSQFEQNGTMAMASTDMGHSAGAGGIWGAVDMQLRVDFGYRGVHTTALIAKELMQIYYGRKPKFSYFSGCSDGGREALMSAQRYPEDFDGIAAGAPSLVFLVQNSMYHGWNAHIVQASSPNPSVRERDLPILHRRAMMHCDEADGLKDGIISDPSCKVDPLQWVCKDDDTRDCLSVRTARAAAELYRGAHEGDTPLVVGSLLPGSEMAWLNVLVPREMPPTPPAPGGDGSLPQQQPQTTPQPSMDQLYFEQPVRTASPKSATEILRSLAFTNPYDPAWKLSDFRFTADVFEQLRPMHAILDASDPDLGPFHQAGGKLLIWHGLADSHIAAANSMAYYQAVRDTIGPDATDDVMRLFLVPGMAHCGNGYGMRSIDAMSPLIDWVESGEAPRVLTASSTHAEAALGRGRNLYPFPFSSRLKPDGDPEIPTDWQKGEPLKVGDTLYRDWAGAEFFEPGFQKFCGFEGMDFICRSRPTQEATEARRTPADVPDEARQSHTAADPN